MVAEHLRSNSFGGLGEMQGTRPNPTLLKSRCPSTVLSFAYVVLVVGAVLALSRPMENEFAVMVGYEMESLENYTNEVYENYMVNEEKYYKMEPKEMNQGPTALPYWTEPDCVALSGWEWEEKLDCVALSSWRRMWSEPDCVALSGWRDKGALRQDPEWIEGVEREVENWGTGTELNEDPVDTMHADSSAEDERDWRAGGERDSSSAMVGEGCYRSAACEKRVLGQQP